MTSGDSEATPRPRDPEPSEESWVKPVLVGTAVALVGLAVLVAFLAGWVSCSASYTPGPPTEAMISSGETVMLGDSFDDPSSGWPESAEGGRIGYVDGAYQVSVDAANRRMFVPRTFDQRLDALTVEVDARVEEGVPRDNYSVACLSEDGVRYEGVVTSRGDYGIVRSLRDEEPEVLDQGTGATAVKAIPGINRLRLDCFGNGPRAGTVVLWVNDVKILQVKDTAPGGRLEGVGMAVRSNEGPLDVRFDDLVIRIPDAE